MKFYHLTLFIFVIVNGMQETVQIDGTASIPVGSGYQDNRPHVIIVLGDDMGWNDVGWHNEDFHTPYMDALAKGGVILDNYYAMPQCTPSRATLMTSVYANNLGLQRGVLMNQEPYGVPLKFTMLPQHLKAAGYQTHMMGKWHIGYCNEQYTPPKRGYDSFFGFYNGAENNFLHCVSPNYVYTKEYCNGLDFRKNKAPAPQYDGQFSTHLQASRAVELINSYQPGDKPLFMYVSITNMHFPVQYTDRYSNLCNTPKLNSARKTFCRAVACLDDAIKNITEALISHGMYENTVLFFMSDNGGVNEFGGNNFPLRGQKSTNWEGGSRVPAFVHSPLLKKTGYVNEKLIHVADIFPTIMELAGVNKVMNIDGVSQWETISENADTKRKSVPYLLDTIEGTILAAVRNDRYKLVVGPGGNADQVYPQNETVDNSFNVTALAEYTSKTVPIFNSSDHSLKLFDLSTDPSESVNVAEANPDIVKELFHILEEYEAKAKPAVKLPTDPAGNPENFGGVYSSGWCKAYIDVPTYATTQGSHNDYRGI